MCDSIFYFAHESTEKVIHLNGIELDCKECGIFDFGEVATSCGIKHRG